MSSHGEESTDVVEIDAIGVDEWEHEQHTPRAMDENLAALVKSSAQSGPTRTPTIDDGWEADAGEPSKQRTTTNTVSRPAPPKTKTKTMALPTVAPAPKSVAAKPAAAKPSVAPKPAAAKPTAVPQVIARAETKAMASPVAKPPVTKPLAGDEPLPGFVEVKPLAARGAAKPAAKPTPPSSERAPTAKPATKSTAELKPVAKPVAKPTPPPMAAGDRAEARGEADAATDGRNRTEAGDEVHRRAEACGEADAATDGGDRTEAGDEVHRRAEACGEADAAADGRNRTEAGRASATDRCRRRRADTAARTDTSSVLTDDAAGVAARQRLRRLGQPAKRGDVRHQPRVAGASGFERLQARGLGHCRPQCGADRRQGDADRRQASSCANVAGNPDLRAEPIDVGRVRDADSGATQRDASRARGARAAAATGGACRRVASSRRRSRVVAGLEHAAARAACQASRSPRPPRPAGRAPPASSTNQTYRSSTSRPHRSLQDARSFAAVAP